MYDYSTWFCLLLSTILNKSQYWDLFNIVRVIYMIYPLKYARHALTTCPPPAPMSIGGLRCINLLLLFPVREDSHTRALRDRDRHHYGPWYSPSCDHKSNTFWISSYRTGYLRYLYRQAQAYSTHRDSHTCFNELEATRNSLLRMTWISQFKTQIIRSHATAWNHGPDRQLWKLAIYSECDLCKACTLKITHSIYFFRHLISTYNLSYYSTCRVGEHEGLHDGPEPLQVTTEAS